ncbi:hypothetical protein Godav_015027, partial [Gossypium davidsonii]|nr:hypothetical protein [Gossypium davidsonii]
LKPCPAAIHCTYRLLKDQSKAYTHSAVPHAYGSTKASNSYS